MTDIDPIRVSGVERLHEEAWASKSDALEDCPWCAHGITLESLVVRHYVQTPEGVAPVAVLHKDCSDAQRRHEELFGGR